MSGKIPAAVPCHECRTKDLKLEDRISRGEQGGSNETLHHVRRLPERNIRPIDANTHLVCAVVQDGVFMLVYAALSSFSAPHMTIRTASSGKDRW